MSWIASALLRLFERAGACPFAGDRRRPAVPMPAGAVIEQRVAQPIGLALTQVGKTQYERELLIVLGIDRLRFARCFSGHSRQLFPPGAAALCEIAAFRMLPR